MIEIELSKSGLPILKSDGRFMNSSYDPMAEAQSWLAMVNDKVKDFDFVILLGVGSAYHCLALRNKYPNKKILILENDKQLLAKCADLFSDLKKINICNFSDSSDLLSNEDVLNFSQEIFCTLRLPSTRFLNKELFDEVETVLTGRASYEFTKLCEVRQQLNSQINFERFDSANLISIKSVAAAFIPNSDGLSPERRVVHILEELVR